MPKKGDDLTERGICEMKNCQNIYLKTFATLFLVQMILPFAYLIS